MRVVLLSSTVFGHHCLEEGIIGTPEVEMTGILTTPSEIDISYSDKPVALSTHASFTDLAEKCGCSVVQMHGKLNASAYLDHLQKWQPDLLLALGWYYLIPRKVRECAPLGCLGIHASLLPKYRGGAPIPWAIINGEKKTGVTLFALDNGVDTGDIIAQDDFPIDELDNCSSVYEKATLSSIEILRKFLPRIANGTATRIKQQEDQATVFPQRKPEDGLIDWGWSSGKIYDFIRAQTHPYPGAFTYLNGRKLHIWKARPASVSITASVMPACIVHIDGQVGVGTGDGIIMLVECQFEGETAPSSISELLTKNGVCLGVLSEESTNAKV